MRPESLRLRFEPIQEEHFTGLHSLITDSHVKEYLLDGQTMSEEWTRSVIHDSQNLFQERQVGVWLLSLKHDPTWIGFCGFRRFPRYGDEPELLYAIRKDFTGNGYATECAQAMIHYVHTHTSTRRLETAVDSPNLGSKRVLEKVGFKKTGEIPGAFGPIYTYEMFLSSL